VTTIGGSPGDGGSQDGVGSDALFYNPFGITVDLTGNLYIADLTNSTIRKGTSSKAQATVSVTNATAAYDGNAHSATSTTNPPGLNVVYFYNGSTVAPTVGGEYTVLAAISDPAYEGTGIGSLTITKGTATVTLGNLAASYDGNPHGATATTNPPGLNVTFTYGSGSSTPPSNVGSYKVIGTIDDPTYQGTQTGTLVISKSTATVSLSDLTATYDGKMHLATATTTPAGLPVTFIYNNSSRIKPINAGTYTVTATINSPNAQGSASDTLTIDPATATVTLGNLNAVFSGKPLPVTVTTTPPKLSVSVTYGNGAPTAPSAVGTYDIAATITNPNYTGSGAGTLTIARVVSTGPALVSALGAQVGFSLNPSGLATMVFFQYGTDSSNLNLSTLQQGIGKGTTLVTINGFLSGLLPNTTYYYQIVIVSPAGTSMGPMESFTTLGFDTTVVAQTGDGAADVSGATFATFSPGAVNGQDAVAFAANLAVVKNGLVTAANACGIWAEDSTLARHLVAQVGSSAPDTDSALFATLTDPVYDNNENIAFGATLKTGGTTTKANATGVWASRSGALDLLAREGAEAPNADGADFATFPEVAISDTGGTIFSATLSGAGVTRMNNAGIWEGVNAGALTLWLRTGEQTDSGKTVATFSFLRVETVVNGQTRGFGPATGHLACNTTYTDGNTGIVKVLSAGSPTAVATSTDPATGTAGATFAAFSSPAINDHNHTAFAATLSSGDTTKTNASGIWADDSMGTRQLIARLGDVSPGTGTNATYLSFGDPVYNANEAVAFTGALSIGTGLATKTTAAGIWCDSTGSLELVAQQGGAAPGCPDGVSFSAFTELALNDTFGSTQSGGAIFLATLSGTGVTKSNNTGIFAVDGSGHLQLIVRTGDVLDGKTVAAVAFLSPETTVNGQSRSFSQSTGDLVCTATFSDKTQAIFNVVFP
jgi:hypothetical protein